MFTYVYMVLSPERFLRSSLYKSSYSIVVSSYACDTKDTFPLIWSVFIHQNNIDAISRWRLGSLDFAHQHNIDASPQII